MTINFYKTNHFTKTINDVFVTLPASGYIKGEYGSADAIEKAKEWLITRLQGFDYENQISVEAS